MKIVSMIIAMLSVCGFADVKPEGTVLETLCGNLNKSVRICHASVQGRQSQYITHSFFLRGTDYIRVTRAENRLGGSSYEGYYVSTIDRRIERRVELHIALVTGGKHLGTLFVDGKQEGGRFAMEEVVHTARSKNEE